MLLGLVGPTALDFAGDVFAARINNHLEKKTSDKVKSVYVEFDAAGGACTVRFKRWSKMELDDKNKVLPAVQGRIIPDGNAFKADALHGSGKVAPVVRKDDFKGFNLNRIAVKTFLKLQ